MNGRRERQPLHKELSWLVAMPYTGTTTMTGQFSPSMPLATSTESDLGEPS